MAVETATGAAEVRVVNAANGLAVSTAALPAGFAPVALGTIPALGTHGEFILVGAVKTVNGSGWVFAFKASNGVSAGTFSVHPNGWPIALAGVSDFAGGSKPAATTSARWRCTNTTSPAA